MGQIKKTATSRHEATLSSAVSEFAKASVSIPLYQLPKHLSSFPRRWPFPRGDLYHWIPVLNRFDRIIEQFNTQYGLTKGPQAESFGRHILLRGIQSKNDNGETVATASSPTDHDTLDTLGFSKDGDRELIESILTFSKLLLENCGNRNLYASSSHLNHLLNTTSLSLLKSTLKLALRLAQRYYTTRQRMPSTTNTGQILSSHYAINIDNLQKLAVSFAKGSPHPLGLQTPVGKGKEKLGVDQGAKSKWTPGDLLAIVTDGDGDERSHVRLQYYESSPKTAAPQPKSSNGVFDSPSTPTPTRRTSNLSQQLSRQGRTEESPASPETSTPSKQDSLRSTSAKVIEISPATITSTSAEDLVEQYMPAVPDDYQHELLHRIRVAHALSSDRKAREDIVAIRLLAVANLAYVLTEDQYNMKFSKSDLDEPRRYQLPYQLAELIHPPRVHGSEVSKDLQTLALATLESLTRHKSKASDIVIALNVNVNHGVLFYVVRKVVAELADGNAVDSSEADEYRDSLFLLLGGLPNCQSRTGETLVSAGLLEVLVQILSLRTPKAAWAYPKVLAFLDTFLFTIRDAFQSFVNSQGLTNIADLVSHEVKISHQNVLRGIIMPKERRTQLTDYEIEWHQQQNLRWLVKLINRMLTHTNANFERLIRNLIESAALLEALRTVLENSKIFGSTIWSTSVGILTNFIHNEPTSYNALAEAKLSQAFLEAVTQKTLPQSPASASTPVQSVPEPPAAEASETHSGTGHSSPSKANEQVDFLSRITQERSVPLASGILPSADVMAQIPPAFGAICLNEGGMQSFKDSQAMKSFFEIFESPAHVQAMEAENEMATAVGVSFDELLRHHPPLKSDIVEAISEMIGRVLRLCHAKASEQGVGARLWRQDDAGELYVAGGRNALTGLEGPIQERFRLSTERHRQITENDVQMSDSTPSGSANEEPSNLSVGFSNILESEDGKTSPMTAQYIGAVSRFLSGFFSNSNSIVAFAESSGLELFLEYALIPSLPYNAADDSWSSAIEELARVMQPLIEQKPHLTLPRLISYAQEAVDVLKPLLDHTGEDAFFSGYTAPEGKSKALPPIVKDEGTKYVKALVSVQGLCSILSYAFQNQIFSQRTNHNLFNQINLADMYARLTSSLGQLHRSCVWEEVLLQRDMPREWEEATSVKNRGSHSEELDSLLEIPRFESAPSDNPTTGGSATDPQSLFTDRSSGDGVPRNTNESATARFKNTRTLRFLLCRVPTAITPLLQSLGRLLLFRRGTDAYHRQCAFVVADQIAESALDQLRFEHPKNSASAKDRYPYWITILNSISRIMIDDTMERGFTQTLTMILLCFKNQDGFSALDNILQEFYKEATSITEKKSAGSLLTNEEQGLLNLSFGGIKIILTFYSQIINSKIVVDAAQTSALTSMSSRERERLEIFSVGQFLVELRTIVIRPVMQLWQSGLMDNCTTLIVKSLIDTLKIVLEGEGENGAHKRSDRKIKRLKPSIKAWTLRNPEHLKRLKDDNVEEGLAREALYRCNDSQSAAREYSSFHSKSFRPIRNPIPAYELESAHNASAPDSSADDNATVTEASSSSSEESEIDRSVTMEDVSQADASGEATVPDATPEAILERLSGIGCPSYFTRTPADDSTQIPTVEDLDEKRDELKKTLIDRSLEVLNVHDDITFDLSDLITAAVAKATDSAESLRAEIGSTLIQYLLSLQMEEDLRPNSKKIAASAHLLGLALQDKAFYDANLEELKDNFSAFIGFIKVYENREKDESFSWVAPILLVMEMVLSNDTQPHQIQWTPPEPESDTLSTETPAANLPEPVVSLDAKSALFEAILDVLGHVGKDESLALSISRALVVLTRTRSLASLLSRKQNIRRLFLMVKQLAGITIEKLQSALMMILRHIVEDDDTIRQLMRSEIQVLFENRETRQKDTTAYTRQMYHLAIRSPEIFVEVTNEKLMLQRWDSSQRPQTLTLKKISPPSEDDSAKPNVETTAEEGGAATSADKAMDAPESKTPGKLERTKTQELRCPVVENPDGVIHYLLCELLAYKDVQDNPLTTNSNKSDDAPLSSDVEMDNNDSSTSTNPPDSSEQSKPEKQEFKADEHPIFLYRCFILQCLAELLTSYNRAKVEFINFSRKADPHASTPSKPRSGILNYLLNGLLPRSILESPSDIASQKQTATSNCAIMAVVALCAKTDERPLSRTESVSEIDEDPDLLYVRRFVLEHALKSFRDATSSTDPLEGKYARLMVLADMFNRMINGGTKTYPPSEPASRQSPSQKQVSRIMYEKNFITTLTGAIAEIDLNFPHAERAVKAILKALRTLTSTGVEVSTSPDASPSVVEMDDDEVASSASSISDVDDREATPDLFRNSTLGMLDPGHQEEYESDSEEDEDDEDDEMDEGYYDDEMDYEEDNIHGNEDAVSEPDEEIEGIGHIEGLSGEIGGIDVEIEDGSTNSEMDEDDDEDDEDEDDDDDMADDILDRVEIIAEGETPSDVDSDAEDEWENAEDTGEDYPGQDDIEDDEAHIVDAPLDNLVRVINGQTDDDLGIVDLDRPEYDETPGEDDDDEPEEYDDEIYYGTGYEDEDDDDHDMAWGHWNEPPTHRGHHHHHHHLHHLPPPRSPWAFTGSNVDRGLLAYRSHRPGPPQRGNDEGTNPLLQRTGRSPSSPPMGSLRHMAMTDFFHSLDPTRPGHFLAGDGPVSFISNLINAMGHGSPSVHTHNGNIHLSFGTRSDQVPPLPASFEAGFRRDVGRARESRSSGNSPIDAINFIGANTMTRWVEEARLLFGQAAPDKGGRLINSILKLLVPPAIEAAKQRTKEIEERQARKAQEEAEARQREEKERLEREAQEKKEREEREAAEVEARAREQVDRGDAEDQAASAEDASNSMDGVEGAETEAAQDPSAAPSEPTQRVTTQIRGREIDISALGIDMEYLEALPDELREEVLMQRVAEQRHEAVAAGEAPTDISPEFLEALPADIREEILQQEAQDRRRREREEARRRAAASGGAPNARGAEEMDPASFLASLDPGLRQAVLMDQDEEMLAQLPLEIAAEARALGGDRHLNQLNDYMPRAGRRLDRAQHGNEAPQKSLKPRPAAQMLDKAGIATLLRLMFIPQEKRYLNETLKSVCQNRQNRAEVISILLSILQDGSADVSAVERSFAQLTIRAKQPALQRTPQPKRSLVSQISSHSELSPLMVVNQCLNTLTFLAERDSHIPPFFLTEHETGSTLKSKASRKGKGKDTKVNRFPLNALLSLLDRKIVIDSSAVMEQLASLLSKITTPLQALLKKEQEKPQEKEKGESSKSAAQQSEPSATASEPSSAAPSGVSMVIDEVQPETSANTTSAAPPASGDSTAEPSTSESKDDWKAETTSKRTKTLVPPEIPDYNLRLVVNILAARECNSRTFRDTLSLISHLSAIPGSKEIFGQELIKQAQELSKYILKDLADLVLQVSNAQSGTDVQGMALAKFSPASSDQAKLLRVITALDYLFDPKKADTQNKPSTKSPEALSAAQKEDILSTLYENATFAALWSKLSECLTAIRQRGSMLNVATILLPVIEVLMVVCKNTTSKDNLLSNSQMIDFAISSPPPEGRMESLFYSFTEEHRKILNDLVRHNPKLMSGSFSLLVENPKVLEFDNKRNFFSRSLHSRTEVRQPHQPLQLQVRRDQVFLDSFKSLYFKSAEEMKYGKLSIRFHGEEGVDAGGVTREWFQVLSRQMFDPNYALFVPVASDRTTFHPNRLSAINAEHLLFFKFIGRIIGKALYEGRVLDCHFSRAVYKRILGKPVHIKDMESLDIEYHKSLLWMLENDITDIITETFSAETEAFGEVEIVDLIENGRNIPVTEENKHEYVRLVVEYKLTGSVREQLEEFLRGFHDIVPAKLISIFNEQELELLISGLPDIDADDWRQNTEYHHYTAASPQIQWFWRAVKSFDKEERAKLLQFVTGTSKVPLNGFKELEGMNGFSKFNIHRDPGNKDRLPSSHTCFNQMDLPEYDSYERLRERLYTAMTAGSEYFGFA